jgi:hypothetical protein
MASRDKKKEKKEKRKIQQAQDADDTNQPDNVALPLGTGGPKKKMNKKK